MDTLRSRSRRVLSSLLSVTAVSAALVVPGRHLRGHAGDSDRHHAHDDL